MAELRLRLTALLVVAVVIAACSNALPAAECEVAQWPPPPDMVGCEDAVAAATTALPAGHPRIVRIQFYRGIYCPPGAYCPITPPSVGVVFFTFESGILGQRTDAYMQVVRENDGRVRVGTALTPIVP